MPKLFSFGQKQQDAEQRNKQQHWDNGRLQNNSPRRREEVMPGNKTDMKDRDDRSV